MKFGPPRVTIFVVMLDVVARVSCMGGVRLKVHGLLSAHDTGVAGSRTGALPLGHAQRPARCQSDRLASRAVYRQLSFWLAILHPMHSTILFRPRRHSANAALHELKS